jgi:hypothetical protein
LAKHRNRDAARDTAFIPARTAPHRTATLAGGFDVFSFIREFFRDLADALTSAGSGPSDWESHDAGSRSWEPTVNIDGSPMIGGVDIHGNPYGVTSSFDHGSTLDTGSSWLQPSVNIDGTPMIGSIDVHGNPYGVTSSHDTFQSSTSWDSGSSWSSSDSWSSSSWSSSDSFGSSF